jgi:hypothetical protein
MRAARLKYLDSFACIYMEFLKMMNYRTYLFCFVFLATGCATQQPVVPDTATATLPPSPTITLTIRPTSTPPPTAEATFTPVPPTTGREIIFDESGDKPLAGTLYGEGETAIILANMTSGGEQQWNPFVAAVDKQMFTTVTFNYRSVNNVGADIQRILSWLKEQGFERVICIGASLGSQACGLIAREPELVGTVLISGPVNINVAEITYPKLLIASTRDSFSIDIKAGYDRAAEPKELLLFEDNSAHGTDIFSSDDGDAFLTRLIDFVNGLATP